MERQIGKQKTALLRAENEIRIPWILNEIGSPKKVLDIGCGIGLLSNALAKEDHEVVGVDLSPLRLNRARRADETQSVDYRLANAYSLPFPDQSFDVVCALDILEQVGDPELVIAEASRVLKPEGLFFFHSLNWKALSFLSLKNRKISPLSVDHRDLKEHCDQYRLNIKVIHGFRPVFNQAFFKALLSRKISKEFAFRFSKSPVSGYCGIAIKRGSYVTNHS